MDRVLDTLRRLAGLPAGLVVWLALAVVPAGLAVDPDDTPGPDLHGTPVPAAAGSGTHPALTTGRHLDRLPGEQPRTYELDRTAVGSTFHVGAMFIGAGDSIGEGLRLGVGTTPGSAGCGSAGVFRPTAGEPSPLLFTTVSTWTDVSDHPCAVATTLYLTLHPPSDPSDVGRRVELLVYEEPPLSSYAFDLLTAPPTPAWTPLTPITPTRITAGRTPENAPVVDEGTYRIPLEPGRTSMLAIPLDWDQSLQAQLDADLPSGPATGDISVDVVGPLLGASQMPLAQSPPDDWTASPPPRGGRLRTGAQSQVVSYVHRDSLDTSRNTETLAGLHFVMVTWTDAEGVRPRASSPATITLRISGTPGEGIPDYPEMADLPRPQAPSRLVVPTPQDAAEVPPPGDQTDDPAGASGRRTVVLVVGAVLCCVLVLAAAARLRRRADAHRHGQHRS